MFEFMVFAYSFHDIQMSGRAAVQTHQCAASAENPITTGFDFSKFLLSKFFSL